MSFRRDDRSEEARAPTERLRGRAGVEQRARRIQAEPLCRLCMELGLFVEATQIDHIEPLIKGGSDDDANTQPLCDDCHKAKTRAEFTKVQQVGLDGWPV